MSQTILHVTLNTADQAHHPASVVRLDLIQMLRPFLAALLPAGDGIPRQRPMLPPLQQYTVQAVALDSTAPCFRVYAPPARPVPPEGIELDALVSFGVAVCPGPAAAALWASLHELAGQVDLTLTDPHAPPRAPWCGVLCHPALSLDLRAAAWLGDFERGVAWTVVTMAGAEQ